MEVELCVNLCRLLTVDIFQLAIFKFSLFCIKIFMTPLLLFQFYLFLEKFELAYFVQYGPIYFLMFYELVCVLCQKYTTSVITTYLHEIQIWKLEQAPAEIKETVKKTWFFITLYMLGAVVLSLVVSVLYVIPTSQDKKFIFVFQIANTYFPYL
ncbi:hypothetical protein Zmor_018271 [Zophobas morio]|uniref:Uncharacterized protein n=1 Tax=Zophobas morio TaxID=2755281 RepID=A0AA38IB69_9CUCU|nr:hypothetical protein Zmor_018271 [Zophobas morio]